MALGGKHLGEDVQRRRAHAMQGREADADAVVHIDSKVHQLVGRVAKAVDVGGDVVEGDGAGASRLYGRAFGDTGNPIGEGSLQATGNGEGGAGSAFDIGLGGGVEFHAKRLADVEGGGADEGHAGLTGVVFEGGLGTADAENAVAGLHRARLAFQRQMVAALLVGAHRPQRQRAVALARPELQDVAFCQSMGALQIGGAIAHLVDAAEEQAAVVGTLVTHDIVAAFAVQIGRGKPAGESVGEAVAIGIGDSRVLLRQSSIESFTVDGGHGEDVLGRLHAALDFKRRHAGGHEVVHAIHRAQILGRKQVIARRGKALLQSLVLQLIGKPARLSAHPPVGRAAADHGGHEALARVAHAQCAVGEHLHFHPLFGRRRAQKGDLVQRHLTGERNALGP